MSECLHVWQWRTLPLLDPSKGERVGDGENLVARRVPFVLSWVMPGAEVRVGDCAACGWVVVDPGLGLGERGFLPWTLPEGWNLPLAVEIR